MYFRNPSYGNKPDKAEVLQYLIRKYPDLDFDKKDGRNCTALEVAVRWGPPDAAEILLGAAKVKLTTCAVIYFNVVIFPALTIFSLRA